jgi:hypothetical protein
MKSTVAIFSEQPTAILQKDHPHFWVGGKSVTLPPRRLPLAEWELAAMTREGWHKASPVKDD